MAAKLRTKPYGVTPQGDRLFDARVALGLTQEQMADRCDLERTAYLNMENGKNKLSTVPARRSLAKGFGVAEDVMGRYLDEGGDPRKVLVPRKALTLVRSETTVVYDERYPNRAEAIESAAKLLQISIEQATLLAPLALDSDEDPPPVWWFDQIRSRHAAEEKGVRLGLREITDDE
jgi:transcriptional regulator with XRE-family HTH domain